jgi:hypothetical protein
MKMPHILPSCPRIRLRVRALHCLARRKRWPVLACAALLQDTVDVVLEEYHNFDRLALRAVHIVALYLLMRLVD